MNMAFFNSRAITQTAMSFDIFNISLCFIRVTRHEINGFRKCAVQLQTSPCYIVNYGLTDLSTESVALRSFSFRTLHHIVYALFEIVRHICT